MRSRLFVCNNVLIAVLKHFVSKCHIPAFRTLIAITASCILEYWVRNAAPTKCRPGRIPPLLPSRRHCCIPLKPRYFTSSTFLSVQCRSMHIHDYHAYSIMCAFIGERSGSVRSEPVQHVSPTSTTDPLIKSQRTSSISCIKDGPKRKLFMVALWNGADRYIFAMWFLSYCFF